MLHPNEGDKYPTIFELKVDKDVDEVLGQIEQKSFYSTLKGHMNHMLLVGINYDSKTKTHQVKIKDISVSL